MSLAAAHESKQAKNRCAGCCQRKARFRYRGRVRADRDHTLCFECYRAQNDRRRPERLAGMAPAVPMRSPFRMPLTERQIEHRRAMLEHLQRVTVAG